MNPIEPTIKPDDSGDQVANLQVALVFLLERRVWKTFDPPNTPSTDELRELVARLRDDQSAQVFGKATRKLLVYFQIQQGLGDHLHGVVEETTAKRLNELLSQLGVVFNREGFVVSGRVTNTLGQPGSGLKVVAFDRDLRRQQRLGEVSTDSEGHYEISYQPEDFRRAEGKVPLGADLFVLVLPDDSLEPLATSEVRFNAKPLETIDVVVPAVGDGPSEFERITALVMPLLVGQGTPSEVRYVVADPIPTDLQPYELNTEDIKFVVHETGLDAAALEAWAEGARLLHEAQQLQPQEATADDRNALKSQ